MPVGTYARSLTSLVLVTHTNECVGQIDSYGTDSTFTGIQPAFDQPQGYIKSEEARENKNNGCTIENIIHSTPKKSILEANSCSQKWLVTTRMDHTRARFIGS